MSDPLIDRHAAELVEEIMESIDKNTGRPWMLIIASKMEALLKAEEQRRCDEEQSIRMNLEPKRW